MKIYLGEDTVHSTRIPHFPQSSDENLSHRELTSISKVRFPRIFLNFSPRTFYRPSEDKLRELRRFSSAEIGGHKMAAIDDCRIKLHLA